MNEKSIYESITKYFDTVSVKDLRPNSWKVPIGGGYYGAEEVNEVVKCYLHGSLSIQTPVIEFENKFSNYIGTNYGIATNSGTSANILALNALIESGDLKAGDEVALPATTFISVATPIIQLGLVPVYIDIEPHTLNIDIDELENAIRNPERNIKCAMIVHTLGNPANMTKIMQIAEHLDIKIIEDCCEAHGAEWNGKKVGSFGIISTWSFYVAHHMTTAEGGMALTNSDELNVIIRELREFGRNKSYQGERYGMNTDRLHDFDERYTFHRIGWNFRMADAPASFGIKQLEKLDDMTKIRIDNAKYLTKELSKFNEHIEVLENDSNEFINSYYSFPIIIKNPDKINRKDFTQYLESNSIETRAIMCGTLPDQPSLVDIGHEYGGLEGSRYIMDNSFFVGCHPCLEKDELDHIIHTITNYLTK